MQKFIAIVFLLIGLCSLTNEKVWGSQREILLTSENLVVHSPMDSTLGNYYGLSFRLPRSVGETVSRAFLEFYLDVDSRTRELHTYYDADSTLKEAYVNDTAMLEVYALDAEVESSLDPSKFRRPARTVKNIRSGASRRVIMDITTIVREDVREARDTTYLVLGSLTGSRNGVFSLKSDSLQPGTVARIVLHLNRRP